MSDGEFKEYINSLDSSVSYEIMKKLVMTRGYNKNLLDDMKIRANNTYLVEGCNCGYEHEVSIVEAHHIEKFSLTQNNKLKNILILCPNNHRLIHKTKASIDKEKCIIDYKDEITENYTKII